MLKIALKYAVVCSIFQTIIFYLSLIYGSNPFINLGHLLFDLVLFGIFIFFAQKEFKTGAEGNLLYFWQGMTIGFTVYTSAAVLFSMMLLGYLSLSPDALENYQQAALQFLESKADTYIKQFGEATYQLQVEEIMATSPRSLTLSVLFKKILAGFFVTPVISIILRKKPL